MSLSEDKKIRFGEFLQFTEFRKIFRLDVVRVMKL